MFRISFFSLFAIALLINVGCSRRWDESRFNSAVLLEDEVTGVFTYEKKIYRLKSSGGFMFGGGTPHFIKDVKIIGLCNVESKEVTVLYREEGAPDGDGRGELIIRGQRGNMLLLTRDPTRQPDAEHGVRYYLFDVSVKKLQLLNLKDELAERGMGLGQSRLVKSDGTIVLESYRLEDEKRNWHRDETIPLFLWVRFPDGQFWEVAKTREYRGFLDDSIYLNKLGSQDFLTFNIQSRDSRDIPRPKTIEAARELNRRFDGPRGTRWLMCDSVKGTLRLEGRGIKGEDLQEFKFSTSKLR